MRHLGGVKDYLLLARWVDGPRGGEGGLMRHLRGVKDYLMLARWAAGGGRARGRAGGRGGS